MRLPANHTILIKNVRRRLEIEASAITDTGPVRPSNQDTVGSFPDLGLFVVADGMGGLEHGELASRLAVSSLRDFVAGAPTADPQTLRSGIARANTRVMQEAVRLAVGGPPVELGTTIVVLLLSSDATRANWAHVGDSRLYRFRGERLTLLTADHTRPGEAYRDSREIPLDLEHTNQLCQALGLTEDIMIATSSDAVQPGDLFLLCSDGVSGALHPAALHDQLRAAGSLEALGRVLVDLAQEASGRDNASAVLVRVTPG